MCSGEANSTFFLLGAAFAALAPTGAVVTVYARRREAATAELSEVAARLGVPPPDVQPWELASARLGEADLVVSTTPAGAADGLVVDLTGRVAGVLFDVVYAPWPTVLAAAWSARGGVVIGGLDLLVEQAALQVELMTGHLPDVGVMRNAGALAIGGG